MKLYLLQQNTFSEGNFGDLVYTGLKLIGVYTNISIPQSIIDNFIPVEFNAQFGSGLQDLILTEIESDSQLNELETSDNIYEYGGCDFDEEPQEEFDERIHYI